jgi:hypothetical protein
MIQIWGYLSGCLAIVLLGVAVKAGGRKKEQSYDEQHFIVRYPAGMVMVWRFFFGINVVSFLAIVLSNSLGEDTVSVYAFYALVLMVLAGLMLRSSIWRIEVTGDKVCCYALFQKAVIFSLADIDKVVMNGGDKYHGLTIYAMGKVVATIPAGCRRSGELLIRLEERGTMFVNE